VCCDGIRSTAAAAKVNNNSKANQLIGCQFVGEDTLGISLNNVPSTVLSSLSATKDKCKSSYFKLCALNIHSLIKACHSTNVADLCFSHDLD